MSAVQRPIVPAISQDSPFHLSPESPIKVTLRDPLKYQFELETNEYFRLSIQKTGTDVELSILGPDNQAIRVVPCFQDGPLNVSEVALHPGAYTARLKYCDPRGQGLDLEIVLSRPRVALSKDRLRVAAEHLSSEAEMAAAQYRSASLRTAIKKNEDAAAKWEAADARIEEVHTLLELAKLYSRGAESVQAKKSIEKAVGIVSKIHDSAAEVDVLLALATFQWRNGDLVRAEELAKKALDESRSLPNHTEQAEALLLMGRIYYDEDDKSKESASVLEQARRIFEKLENRVGLARSLIKLASIDGDQRNYSLAIDAAQKSLAIFQSVGDRQGEGHAHIILGNIQYRMGNPREALDEYNSFIQDSGDVHEEAQLFAGIAQVYSDLGEHEYAQIASRQALEKIRSLNNKVQIPYALEALGLSMAALNDTGSALAYLRQALEGFRNTPIPDKKGIAWVLYDTALVYETANELEKAFESMRSALEMVKSFEDPDRGLEVRLLIGVGGYHEAKGEIDVALQYYRQALTLSGTFPERLLHLDAQFHVASSLNLKGDFAEASRYVKRAVDEVESVRASLENSALRTSYFASARKQYELYIDTLMNLDKEDNSALLDIKAFEASEQSHARTLVESIGESHLATSEGVDPKLIVSKVSVLARLDSLSIKHQNAVNANGDSDTIAKLREDLSTLKEELDRIEAQIRSQSPKYAAQARRDPLTLPEIRRELDDSVMLEYSLGDRTSYLFLVTQQDFKSYRLPGRLEIESKVRRFRDSIMTPYPVTWTRKQIEEAITHYQQDAKELGRMLLGPAADQLGDRRMVIVPDGILQTLPFGALAISPSAQAVSFSPLAKEHEIAYLPSASALVASRRAAPLRGHPDRTIAVINDPVYQRTEVRDWNKPTLPAKPAAFTGKGGPVLRGGASNGVAFDLPRLTYTQDEAKAILNLVPADSRLELTGFGATKSALKGSELERFKILHIGAHSILNEAYPDLSSLEFSKWDKNGNPLDSSLWLRDISNLRLSAELVVLSACDTGLGKEIKGEGLMSMVRGFMSSGVPRVLDTLWKVDDKQTAGFMAEFYKQLLEKKLSPSAALREAQKALMEKPYTQSPYYWAGFQLQGDWRITN